MGTQSWSGCFWKRETLLLTVNYQKDYNWVTANLLRNISIKNVFFLYVAPQLDRSKLTYMLHKSSHWTIYLNSLVFKSYLALTFNRRIVFMDGYISHVRPTNLYLKVFWNQILSYPEVEQVVASFSFLFVSIQLTVTTSRYNATCINGRRVSTHGTTPNEDRKSTHYGLLACVML